MNQEKKPYDIERWVEEQTLDRLGFVKRFHDFPRDISERAYSVFTEPTGEEGLRFSFFGGFYYHRSPRKRNEIYFGRIATRTHSCTAVINQDWENHLENSGLWYALNVYLPPSEGTKICLGELEIFIISRELLKPENLVKSEELQNKLVELYQQPVERNLRERLKRRWEKLYS